MRKTVVKTLMLTAMLFLGQASAQAAQLFFNGSVITPLADAGTKWGVETHWVSPFGNRRL